MATPVLPPARCPSSHHRIPGLIGICGLVVFGAVQLSVAATWRIGDGGQPWRLYPVSFMLDTGDRHRAEYMWGGTHAMEVVIDDDGDGLIDEDPVDVVDDDGDYRYNEDPPDRFDNDQDGVADEDPTNGVDDDGDGLIDEDPVDFIDNDKDGLINEDGPDPQFDNDGDGFLNEDGRYTGGTIHDPALRGFYEQAPFFRHPDDQSAAADPQGPGYGWGDDDRDTRFNEDPIDGLDNDGDSLVDEDPVGPPASLPSTWRRMTFRYDAEALTQEERRALSFVWEGPEQSQYTAMGPAGEMIRTSASRSTARPRDWLRPVRADSTRNMVTLSMDRFLSGMYGTADPANSSGWNSSLSGTAHAGTAGYGQTADGSITTARIVADQSPHFRIHFVGLFWLDLIRMRPRPDFADRTPMTFDIWYAGDKPNHFQQRSASGQLSTRMVVQDPIIPRQTDQLRPAIKEFHFEERGEWGPPQKVRILYLVSRHPKAHVWEVAEFEAYGHGYMLDGNYVTEIIDVGARRPRFRRYFDPDIPDRPVPFEYFRTADANKDGQVQPEERSDVKAGAQFDPDLAGAPKTWGRMRWHGHIVGDRAGVQVRVRSGTSPDTRIWHRRVGGTVLSPFVERPITADWPTPGQRIDASMFVQLPGLVRPRPEDLPYNTLSNRDGQVGGWTPWTAPFSFEEGLVERDGEGGVLLPLPPLHRYIQFRFDFEATQTSAVHLDYIEFEYFSPVVSRGVMAEIFPDTTAHLGLPAPFQLVLKPDMASSDLGFNRIDIAVPSLDARVDSLLVDDLSLEPVVPGSDIVNGKAWLDSLSPIEGNRYASATYLDSAAGVVKLGIKTRTYTATDFPRGQDREIEIALSSPLYSLLTRFDSWVWNDAVSEDVQPTQPGNASDKLPSDQVEVTVLATEEVLGQGTIGPNPFTPNNDGINDVITFGFELFLVTAQTDVSLTIFTLDGRPVHRQVMASKAGKRQLQWDGRDQALRPVPPGVYLYRITVDTDNRETQQQSGTVAVAY